MTAIDPGDGRLIDEFLALTKTEVSRATLDKRRRELHHFAESLNGRPLRCATPADVGRYAEQLDVNAATRCTYLSGIGAFYKWAFAATNPVVAYRETVVHQRRPIRDGLPNTPHTEPEGLTLGPYVRKYIGARRRRGEITDETAKSFSNTLWSFAVSFGQRRLEQLGPAAVDKWLEDIAQLASSTRSSRLSALRNFARWMVNEDLVARDFTRRAPRIRRVRLVSRNMGLGEFLKVLDVCCDSRERVIVWLEFGLGLRAIEVSRLRVDDWNVEHGVIYVVGKALHERELPVPDPVRQALVTYLSDYAPAVGDPLIRNELRPRDPVSASRISNLVSGIIARTDIKRRPYDGISGHGFRAAAASDLLDTGCDVRVVQQFLGHQSLATTSAYLRKISTEKMREALADRTWTPVDQAAAQDVTL